MGGGLRRDRERKRWGKGGEGSEDGKTEKKKRRKRNTERIGPFDQNGKQKGKIVEVFGFIVLWEDGRVDRFAMLSNGGDGGLRQ